MSSSWRRPSTRWSYGSTGDADSGRTYLEKFLNGKIRAVEQVRRLTPAQKQRLLLAGRGDIKRLFDRIEEERKEFELSGTTSITATSSSTSFGRSSSHLRQGPFEFDSIFAKTLKKMLDEGELARRPMASGRASPG